MTRHFHLVAILLSIFIPRAFAETSSNDPLIMQLRTQFVNARIQAEPSVSNNSKVVLAYLVCKRRDRRILIAPPSSSSSSDYSFGSVPETHHHHADHGGCDAGHSH